MKEWIAHGGMEGQIDEKKDKKEGRKSRVKEMRCKWK